MKYFDAHTHVNFIAFKGDIDESMRRAKDAHVGMNVVGTQLDTSRAAVEIAQKYDNAWATIGLHPVHTSRSYHDELELGEGGKAFTSRGEVFAMEEYRALAKLPKVIAIGECGLDYFRLEENTKKVQMETFVAQIELANSLNKPLMLHIRPALQSSGVGGNAYDDALDILKAHAKVKGDVHFFAGSWETAKKFFDFGFTVSFTGVITFTHDYDEVIQHAPSDMLLSETDAPYVSPVPFRGKRNEPHLVTYVVERMAAIRKKSPEDMAAQLLANARRVFPLVKA